MVSSGLAARIPAKCKRGAQIVSKIMSGLAQMGWSLLGIGLGVAAQYLVVRWKWVELQFQRAEYRYDRERDRIWARFEIKRGWWARTSQVPGAIALVEVFDEQGRSKHSASTIWSVGAEEARLAEFTGRETALVFDLVRRPQVVLFWASSRTPEQSLYRTPSHLENCADWNVKVTVTSSSTGEASATHTVREFLEMARDPESERHVRWPPPRQATLGEGELFRHTGDKIYLWTGETMRHIETPDVFNQAGCNLADVWKVSDTWWRNHENRRGEPIRDSAELKDLVRCSQ